MKSVNEHDHRVQNCYCDRHYFVDGLNEEKICEFKGMWIDFSKFFYQQIRT